MTGHNRLEFSVCFVAGGLALYSCRLRAWFNTLWIWDHILLRRAILDLMIAMYLICQSTFEDFAVESSLHGNC